jgi:UDPglucose 6-dehydrogenase
MKVGFVGIGKLGQDVAEVMQEHYDIVGYDVEPRKNTTVPMVTTLKEACEGKDIVFVAVPTPHHTDYDGRYPTCHLAPKDFGYQIVTGVIREIDHYVDKNTLIVLISTTLPGTVRREIVPLVNRGRFIYNPYLIAQTTVKWDMVNPEMVIIGTEDGSVTGDAKLLSDFYQPIMSEGTRIEIGTWDEAECIKIFYNTFISTKLALVNMIQDVSEKMGNINSDVVANALKNSTMRIMGPRYMKPAFGDGGGCHPRDNIALRWLAEKLNLGYDLFEAIMVAREEQARNMALAIAEYNLPVCIVGRGFKPGTTQEEGSVPILTGYYLDQMGRKVDYDRTYNNTVPYVYLVHDHDMFKDMALNKNSVVFDPWRQYEAPADREDIVVRHYGDTRGS